VEQERCGGIHYAKNVGRSKGLFKESRSTRGKFLRAVSIGKFNSEKGITLKIISGKEKVLTNWGARGGKDSKEVTRHHLRRNGRGWKKNQWRSRGVLWEKIGGKRYCQFIRV